MKVTKKEDVVFAINVESLSKVITNCILVGVEFIPTIKSMVEVGTSQDEVSQAIEAYVKMKTSEVIDICIAKAENDKRNAGLDLSEIMPKKFN